MSGKRWKIASVRGIPVYVSTSWVFIAALLVYTQYLSLTTGTNLSSNDALPVAVLMAGLFFGAVLAHEAAHAAMARALDLPVSGITLVFWGGATETRANARGPLAEFLVAFVGPATTFALAGVFWVAAQLIHGAAREAVHYLAFISVLFAGVNALPGFPLDGGRMLLAAMWGITRNRRTALRITGYVGLVVGGGMLAAAFISLTRGGGWWLFLGYIGAIMMATGRAMDARVALLARLATGRAADAMRPPPPAIPADMTLSQALDLFLRDAPEESFPVVDSGRVIGTASLAGSRKIGGRDPMRPVRDAITTLNQTPLFTPEDTLDDVVEWLGGRDGLVLRDGALVGAIGAGDVERWFRRVVEGRETTPAGAWGDSVPNAWGSAAPGGPGGIPPRPDR
ncbi:MAG: site-2 protease family protein [Actinomycetota bacterium]|nr:site-2 protease family protein [Actinomycetota bacterium]